MNQHQTEKNMLLSDLLKEIVKNSHEEKISINGIQLDSRKISSGNLFIAIPGSSSHGMQFFQHAVDMGAVAVLTEESRFWDEERLKVLSQKNKIPIFITSDLRKKVGVLAARFFDNPGNFIKIVGITGTNGKTSVAHFIAQVLNKKIKTGIVGTLGYGLPRELKRAKNTTPDAVRLQNELAYQKNCGVEALIMEVSSHALDQDRVSGIPFHSAVFTNLSRDHLDYHGSMEAYAEAKAKLFVKKELKLAVINTDDSFGLTLVENLKRKVPTIACGSAANTHICADRFVRAKSIKTEISGINLSFDSSWGGGDIRSSLLGRFNAENILLSLGILLGWGIPIEVAINELEKLDSVDGRMSQLGGGLKPKVVIDYAHTPDALEKALSSLREHTQKKLICVFGCGGDRDTGKRPIMGEIASRLADQIFLTNDNPRNENAQVIIKQIKKGIKANSNLVIEEDRKKAITKAIFGAEKGDLVLVAGKGHEDFQIIGSSRIEFSDYEQAQLALLRYAA